MALIQFIDKKNALYIKFVFSDSSLAESFAGRNMRIYQGKNYPWDNVHSRLCIREKVVATVPKIRVVNNDKIL